MMVLAVHVRSGITIKAAITTFCCFILYLCNFCVIRKATKRDEMKKWTTIISSQRSKAKDDGKFKRNNPLGNDTSKPKLKKKSVCDRSENFYDARY
jgi:hypothetical protein